MPLWKKTWVVMRVFMFITAALLVVCGTAVGFMWLCVTYAGPELFFGLLFFLLVGMLTMKMIRDLDLFNPNQNDS